MATELTEYRVYTLDETNRIIGCEEVACTDDRQAFIVSTTLGGAGSELEIWQGHRHVGRLTRGPARGSSAPRRGLISTVGPYAAAEDARPEPGAPDRA